MVDSHTVYEQTNSSIIKSSIHLHPMNHILLYHSDTLLIELIADVKSVKCSSMQMPQTGEEWLQRLTSVGQTTCLYIPVASDSSIFYYYVSRSPTSILLVNTTCAIINIMANLIFTIVSRSHAFFLVVPVGSLPPSTYL